MNLHDLPARLEPSHKASAPNERIPLYVGPMGIAAGQSVWRGTGSVHLDWLPSPTVRFSLAAEESRGPPLPDEARLSLDGYGSDIKGRITSIQTSGGVPNRPTIVSGHIDNGEGHSSNLPLAHVDFLLANFPDYIGEWVRDGDTSGRAGRASLVSTDWTITLDAVDPPKDVSGSSPVEGGYIITHAARLERTDHQAFPIGDAKAVLDDLYWFFSFCRGKPCAPILPSGHGPDGGLVWSEWASWSIAPMSSTRSTGWFNRKSVAGLNELFPAYLAKIREPAWTRALKLATYWYLEAGAVGNDSCLILVQAAFELLAWKTLVQGTQPISRADFEKKWAVDKLRMVLADARMILAVPARLHALHALATASGWIDGPEALVKVRNALVHPTSNSNERGIASLDALSLFHASILSLWYLELLLLHVVGYSGEYSNRTVMTGFRGSEVELVPWAV